MIPVIGEYYSYKINTEILEIVLLIDKEHHKIMRRKSKKTRFLCTCFCLPIILGAIAAAVTFPLFSTHLTENQFTQDDTGRPQTQCPKMPDPSGKAVMLLGSVNS